MFCCKSKNDPIISELCSLIAKNFLSLLIILFPENYGKLCVWNLLDCNSICYGSNVVGFLRVKYVNISRDIWLDSRLLVFCCSWRHYVVLEPPLHGLTSLSLKYRCRGKKNICAFEDHGGYLDFRTLTNCPWK